MQKFDYAKKYHYMLKYFILALPILLFALSYLCKEMELFESMLDYIEVFFQNLRNVPFNSWYNDFLQVLDLNAILDRHLYILISYPLYILWVYIFDILIDLLAIIPRLAHKFISKFGGDY